MFIKIRRFFRTNPKSINILFIPALLLFGIFVLIPIISGVRISFTNWNGYSQSYKYVGIENYITMFKFKGFYQALRNTIIYGFGSTIIQAVLGLAYALLLQKAYRLRGLTSTIIYLPAMLSQLVIGYIWYFLVSYEGGALNDILILFQVEPLDWLANGNRAVFIIMFINSVTFVGKAMIIFLAGLQTIPQMYYEAAKIDGSGYYNTLKNITLPLLLPAFSTSLTLNIIGGLKMFGLVISTTNGGPGGTTHSLSSLINETYFSAQQAGVSAAIGIFTFLFILSMSILLRHFLDNWEKKYYGY